MVANSFAQLLTGFSRRARTFLRKYVPFVEWEARMIASVGARLEALSHALMGVNGEAARVVIAADILDSYAEAASSERLAFFRLLTDRYAPDAKRLKAACKAYMDIPSASHLSMLAQAVESPRRELFRRLNLAPDGTSRLVEMRADLLAHLKAHPELSVVDDDLCAL